MVCWGSIVVCILFCKLGCVLVLGLLDLFALLWFDVGVSFGFRLVVCWVGGLLVLFGTLVWCVWYFGLLFKI